MKWFPEVPLHLGNDDSRDAAEMKVHLYQAAFQRTGGRGFRVPRGTGSKRKHPRMGWGHTFHRVESLILHARYGERHAQ